MTDNSTTPTYEEAIKCPKCKNPGEVKKVQPLKGRTPKGGIGSKLHHVYCKSVLCPWYDTLYFVQVNADGSVPPPTNHTGSPKLYQGFEGHDQEANRLLDTLKRNAQRETEPGAEIRGM
jgi:hypothetical protein